MLAIYAGLALFAMVLQRSGFLTHSITKEHYHDLGKMTFAFTFFWTYTAFSQFMLIWYGNVPDETSFYNYRMFGHWAGWSWVLLVLPVRVPVHHAPVALDQAHPADLRVLHRVAAGLPLGRHLLERHAALPLGPASSTAARPSSRGPLTGPVSNDAVNFNVGDVVAWFGVIALFIGAIGRGMKGNLIPVKDPNLGASLAHENY